MYVRWKSIFDYRQNGNIVADGTKDSQLAMGDLQCLVMFAVACFTLQGRRFCDEGWKRSVQAWIHERIENLSHVPNLFGQDMARWGLRQRMSSFQ